MSHYVQYYARPPHPQVLLLFCFFRNSEKAIDLVEFFFSCQCKNKEIDLQNSRNFPPAAVERHAAFVEKFFSFLPKKESSHVLTRIFLWKKKINIILFLFRLVGNLLHHCCCYIPTVQLQPFNFHTPAPARPTRLKITNIFPPDKASYTQQHFFPLRMPISVKRKKKKK